MSFRNADDNSVDLATRRNPTNLRSSWDLPSDLVNSYGTTSSNKVECEPTRKPLEEISINSIEWELSNKLANSYGKLDDHLPKYSDAEHLALLDAAVRAATSNEKQCAAQRESELINERDITRSKLLQAETNASQDELKLKTCQDELVEAKQEVAVVKMQMKALTFRVQTLDADMIKSNQLNEEKLSELLSSKSHQSNLLQEEIEEKYKLMIRDLINRHTEELTLQQQNQVSIVKQLEKELEISKEKEAKFEVSLVEAVSEAKKHVYAKADAQLAAGNAKYQVLKQQLKEVQAELVNATGTMNENLTQINQLKTELNQSTLQLSSLQENHDRLSAEYQCIILNISTTNQASLSDDFSPSTAEAIATLRSNQSAVKGYLEQIGNLTQSKQLLESMLIEKETQLIELTNMIDLTKKQLTDKEQELLTVSVSMREMETDSEMQLVLVAKLTTSNELLESKQTSLTQQNEELTSRCTNLRNMNAELMQMLESN